MAVAAPTTTAQLSSWTVDQLKAFLRENHLPVSGSKKELVSRVGDCLDSAFFEAELGLEPFQQFHNDPAVVPSFESLPHSTWYKQNFPAVSVDAAKDYLLSKGGYTKNYRTGVRLCQCGHLYDLEMAKILSEEIETYYFRAKCRPTMRKTPPFYPLFVVLNHCRVPVGGNCFCAAGATQSCVHIAALLFTLAEVTQTACTSIRCAWSRPSSGGKATLAEELDFGSASSDGYFPYSGPKPSISSLLTSLKSAGCKPAIADYLENEHERVESVSTANAIEADKVLIRDPFDKLATIISTRDLTVDDLVEALNVSAEEVELIQMMTIGQRNNPLWMDARQWRLTASNFGRVCNRRFRVMYPPSLKKIILGDYGQPKSLAIKWGCDHEDDAIQQYQANLNVEVDVCGFFLSTDYPYLGASPDGLMYLEEEKVAIIEAKCPFKHRHDTILQACQDTSFCLGVNSANQPFLKQNHDYYFQIIGQLAITGAEYCDFVVWTLVDLHIERIFMNLKLWEEMTEKMKQFYYTELGPEIIRRIIEM